MAFGMQPRAEGFSAPDTLCNLVNAPANLSQLLEQLLTLTQELAGLGAAAFNALAPLESLSRALGHVAAIRLPAELRGAVRAGSGRRTILVDIEKKITRSLSALAGVLGIIGSIKVLSAPPGDLARLWNRLGSLFDAGGAGARLAREVTEALVALRKLVGGLLELLPSFEGLSSTLETLSGIVEAAAAVMAAPTDLLPPTPEVVTALATAAYLVYRKWAPLKRFFQNLWTGLLEGVSRAGVAIERVLAAIAGRTRSVVGSIYSWAGSEFLKLVRALGDRLASLARLTLDAVHNAALNSPAVQSATHLHRAIVTSAEYLRITDGAVHTTRSLPTLGEMNRGALAAGALPTLAAPAHLPSPATRFDLFARACAGAPIVINIAPPQISVATNGEADSTALATAIADAITSGALNRELTNAVQHELAKRSRTAFRMQ